MDILYINNVYVNYIVLKIFWYTHQNIVIYWLKYFNMLCLCFVRDIQPQDWTLCCWSSSFSECQDRLPIRRGNIHLLSTCTVAAIPCCSFFPRNWLSGLQTTMLKNWMCLSDLTCHNPGVQRHWIEFCRHASSVTERELTFTPSRQLSLSQICIAVMRTCCYKFNMEHHLIWGRNVKVCTYTWYM